MDKEGQDHASAPVFKSEEIGDKPTTEYFSNIKGGRRDKEKVQNKRSRITRKALFIILGVAVAILLITAIVFTILNIVGNSKIGSRTGEELPTTISDVQVRTYSKTYETGKYADGLAYLNNIIDDLTDANADANLIFESLVFRAEFAYNGGAKEVALNILEQLAVRTDLTDFQKYTLWQGFYILYSKEGNMEEAETYHNKLETLDGLYGNTPLWGDGSIYDNEQEIEYEEEQEYEEGYNYDDYYQAEGEV